MAGKAVRREEGAASMELGIVLPILLILLALVAPLVKAGFEYMVLQRAVAHGVRYASRADVNARRLPDGRSYSRRPSPEEVAAFVKDAASPITIDPADVTVSPNPMLSLPGEPIVVTARNTVTYGPLASIATAVKNLFFGGGTSPPTTVVTVSARGREE